MKIHGLSRPIQAHRFSINSELLSSKMRRRLRQVPESGPAARSSVDILPSQNTLNGEVDAPLKGARNDNRNNKIVRLMLNGITVSELLQLKHGLYSGIPRNSKFVAENHLGYIWVQNSSRLKASAQITESIFAATRRT